MMALLERAYFMACRALGWMLRSVRYSRVSLEADKGGIHVRKSRRFYAPLLIWMSVPLVRILDTGVRVLPAREWQERERRLYWSLGRPPVQSDPRGTLVLPRLAGRTLAALLEDPAVDEPARTRAIEWAVAALAEFHRLGFTHGDAMAENVLVDLEAGEAHWFDFETIHESRMQTVWRRADDVRALVVTCLVRTEPAGLAATLDLILSRYGDAEVLSVLAANFVSVWRRPLAFHLAQAGLSFQSLREIGRVVGLQEATCQRRGNRRRSG